MLLTTVSRVSVVDDNEALLALQFPSCHFLLLCWDDDEDEQHGGVRAALLIPEDKPESFVEYGGECRET